GANPARVPALAEAGAAQASGQVYAPLAAEVVVNEGDGAGLGAGVQREAHLALVREEHRAADGVPVVRLHRSANGLHLQVSTEEAEALGTLEEAAHGRLDN